MAIKLHAGTKEFYQLHKLTKNNVFYRVGDQILNKKGERKGRKTTERGKEREGQLQTWRTVRKTKGHSERQALTQRTVRLPKTLTSYI